MKNTPNFFSQVVAVICGCWILTVMSCSSDDGISNSDDNISDLQLNLSIDEYPRSGNLVGTLSTSLSGDVQFSLLSESASGAFVIIGDDLTVGDWLAYDFEMNEELIAEIEASNESESQTINVSVAINDVDDIWAFLSDSRTAYEQANDGDWIAIIESEYNDLANYLAETTKSGATDAHFLSTSSLVSFQAATVANDNGNTLPEGSYLFAFKNYSWANNAGSSRVKLSEGDAGGPYENVGNTLPLHNDELNYFVLKGSDNPTSTVAHLSMYASVNPAYRNIVGTSYRWVNGNLDNLDNRSIDQVFLHQGLSTTLKQWE